MDSNNEHQMVTRSKRKRVGGEENMVLQTCFTGSPNAYLV